MKILLTLFVLLFSSSVVADDISEFKIEGIGLGDSLLEFFSEKEIKDNIRQDAYIGSDGKFTDEAFKNLSSFKDFDALPLQNSFKRTQVVVTMSSHTPMYV